MEEPDFSRSALCIIGGKGRMGRWFDALFRRAGLKPIISDLGEFPPPQEAVASWDVVVLAAPTSAIEGIMETIGRFLRPDALLMDICSVKQKPLHFMVKYSPSEVVGAHPLFGPSVESISDQILFLCPARTKKWLGPLRKFLENLGARLVEIDPEQHDRLMACCQTLRHVMLAALGQTVAKLGYHETSHGDIMGEWFHQLMTMLRHQALQPPELYADIALENPHSYETLRVFQASLNALVDSITARDRDVLIKAMDDAAQSCNVSTNELFPLCG